MDSARRLAEGSRWANRSRGMASFENLVALANYQEAVRYGRKMVWRDRGEPAVELETLMDCLRHAWKGGLRAGVLGFLLRSGFSLFVALFRIRRTPSRLRSSLVLHALLGSDSFRFAAMLGAFTAIYKFIINALPIILSPPGRSTSVFSPTSTPVSPTECDAQITMKPTPSERRRGRLSFRAQAHEVWIRKKGRQWYAVVAGATAGGIAILFEKKSRRVAIAQQLFVRGLQGSYNSFSHKHGIKVPFGPIIVFSLACGQIMYSFLLRPDTLPHAYNQWILSASQVPAETIKINRSLVREGTFNPFLMQSLVLRPDTTQSNSTAMASYLSAAIIANEFPPRFSPCEATHPWLDSCLTAMPDRFFSVAKWSFPVYGALNFIPLLLFKRSSFVKEPLHMLLRALGGALRSASFLGVFVVIYQSWFCFKHNTWLFLAWLRKLGAPIQVKSEIANILISKGSFWLGGALAGLSLFVEEERRRGELAMYVLPKALESAWVMLRGKGYLFRTGEFGEAWLCAIGMGMVMNAYQHDPQHLSGLVRRILYQFIGPN